jgi:hypothetical protein
MSVYPMIKVALTGDRSGFVIAVTEPPDSYHSGRVLAVGSVLRVDGDGEPEAWRAWLWPLAGSGLHVSQHCDAVDAPTSGELGEKLRKRAAKGAWWR